MGRLIRNAATCTKCGDTIESKRISDVATCSCGALSVSGGTRYKNISYRVEPGAGFVDRSQARPEPPPPPER